MKTRKKISPPAEGSDSRDMQNYPILPPFQYHGYLPEGVHDTNLEQMQQRFASNPDRKVLWERLTAFLQLATETQQFSHAYINGGFITNKATPSDIDVILQPKAPYGPGAFAAMEPFFAKGMDHIFTTYSVHLHFWCEGFPRGMSDFRLFFQYLRPQDAAPLGLEESVRKGIVRIQL